MTLGTLHDNYNAAAHPELNGASGNPATTYIDAWDKMNKIGNLHA